MLDNAMQYSHQLLTEIVQPGDVVIDATMGNGHDTLFLSELVQSTGRVFSFDVQKAALEQTRALFEHQHQTLINVELIHASHDQIDHYVTEPITGAIFNLGYLPGGDKSIITHPTSTISAVQQSLNQLKIGGRIILVCYYGHPGGQEELQQLLSFVAELDQHHYSCLRYEFINQINNPPILLCIERKKKMDLED
ncbi:class I SAM-dependent methyltransferase [Pediococcus pentosaceus]|nr:class I SAM-dependent methyltransferase [Pediococcus pentosaceus]MBF7119764.1 SAM-dependent methyltransferase [Pediococcus pentosaceus]